MGGENKRISKKLSSQIDLVHERMKKKGKNVTKVKASDRLADILDALIGKGI